MARKYRKKHNIPLDTWSTEEWGLFYKEFILCKDRLVRGDALMHEYEFGLILTHMYFECPNYSELSRRTRVGRTAIADAVKSTINKFTL